MKLPRLRFLPLLCLPATLFAAPPAEIVVATYNVENYVADDPADEPSAHAAKPKSAAAIDAVIHVIKDIHPDVLGVCEMGSPERFADFKKRLADAGLGYIASEYVQAADADRHLALVSRFPIVARHSVTDATYELAGAPQKVRRGFLDVTVQVNPDYQLRLVGAHLKSKLPIPEDEAVVRRQEAQLLHRHLDAILAADPQTNLVCYGDFNDTKDQPAIHAITGLRGDPTHMTPLPAKDDLGESWTHFWKTADLYSRIDFLFVSPALHAEVVAKKTRVYRSEFWNEASDHRPVYTTIVPVNKK